MYAWILSHLQLPLVINESVVIGHPYTGEARTVKGIGFVDDSIEEQLIGRYCLDLIGAQTAGVLVGHCAMNVIPEG